MRALLAIGPLGVVLPACSPFTNQPSSSCCTFKSSALFKEKWRCWPVMTSSCALREIAQANSSTNTTSLPSLGVSGDSTTCSYPQAPSLLVFSGGTAFNGVVEELKKFTTRVAHVLPVSDDGGSTSEIVRVLGGPAVGDIRSRCLRLSDESTTEALAVKTLLGYRLSLNEAEAKAEWYEIVEGEHGLWQGVSGPYRETIRAFLVHFQTQILRHSNARFNFRNGRQRVDSKFLSVSIYQAQLKSLSLEAAIFLYSRVCQCPTDSLVLPVICTNDRLTLGSELQDGTIIRGQNEISHPMAVINEQGCPSQAVSKVKHAITALPSPIKRIFYMSSERTNLLHEIFPTVNSAVLEQLRQVDAVVYGMGSLYTSICPSLIVCCLRSRYCGGWGKLLQGEPVQRPTGLLGLPSNSSQVLIVNGSHDRETLGMAASDFVLSVCEALNRKFCNDPKHLLLYLPYQYISVVLVPKEGEILVDHEKLNALHIDTVIEVDSFVEDSVGTIFQPKALIRALHDIVQSSKINDMKRC